MTEQLESTIKQSVSLKLLCLLAETYTLFREEVIEGSEGIISQLQLEVFVSRQALYRICHDLPLRANALYLNY